MWPNNSLSSNSADKLGQCTVTKALAARRLRAWMARASTPFPVSALAAEQHGRIAGGDRERGFQHLLHSGFVAVQDRVAVVGVAGRTTPAFHDLGELPRGERLGEVIERPAAHRLHRRFHAGVRRDQHHGQARGGLLQGSQHIEARFPAEPQVEQHEIVLSRFELVEGLRRGSRLRHAVPRAFQRGADRAPQRDFIVDDEDVHARSFLPGPSCILHGPRGVLHDPRYRPVPPGNAGTPVFSGVADFPSRGTANAMFHLRQPNRPEDDAVDTTFWIPFTAGLGLLAMALILAFAEACDRI